MAGSIKYLWLLGVIAFLGLAFSANAVAQTEIEDCDDLQAMNNDLSEDYVLTQNIDCSDTETWNGGDGFDPVGTSSNPFTGDFDGQGYIVENLYIDRSNENVVGLFGEVADTTIQDVGVQDVDVTGSSFVGGLVGRSCHDYDEDCYFYRVFVTGDLVSTDSSRGESGLVIGDFRQDDGEVRDAYAQGTVHGDGSDVGGLIGDNNNNADTRNTYSTVDVTGSSDSGVSIGENDGHFSNSYCLESANGVACVDDGSADGNVDALTEDEMTGDDAESNMDALDFDDNWMTQEGEYPVLQWQADPDDPIISNVDLDDDTPNEITGTVDVNIDDDDGAADDNRLDSCSVTATGQDNGGSTSVSTSISGDSCSFSVDVDDHEDWEPGEELEFDVSVEDSYDGTDSLSRTEDFFEGEVVLDGNVYPEGGETASTVPEFALDVSHTGGYTVFANFFLEGHGAVGSEQEVDGSGTASVQYDGDFLDREEEYEWYVVLEDNFGNEIDRSDDKWEFVTDTGEPDIQVDAGADINYNPGDGPVVDVTPDHSHARSVQFVRLRDQNGDIVDEVETVEVGESVTLVGEGDSISQDQEYDWTVETEHAGNTESSTVSFTTLTVGVNLASDVPGAEAYNIYRREGSNQGEGSFDFGNEDYEFIGFGESLEIVDSTSELEDGSSYCYVATASNIAGESEPSSEICTEVNTQ